MACPSENELYVAELLNWRVQKLISSPTSDGSAYSMSRTGDAARITRAARLTRPPQIFQNLRSTSYIWPGP